MTRFPKIIGMVTLCSFLAGCSGFQQVPWYTPGQVPEEGKAGDRGELQTGDRVRVVLVMGESIEGEFVSSDADSIDVFVEISRDEEGAVRTFSWSDIASIEKYDRKALATGLVIIGVILVGYVAGGLIYLGIAYDN